MVVESVKLSLTNELIKSACDLSMKAHSNEYYVTNSKKHGSGSSSSSSLLSVAIFAFKGTMEIDSLYSDDHFGETKVDSDLFPSLQRIGEGQLAKVNGSILQIFKNLLTNSEFKSELKKAVEDGKNILLTGHSFGGAIASLATLWILDEYTRKQKLKNPIGCVTFGSPLIGDSTVTHAVRREKWAGHFTHFVMERDIVPRMMLAPKTSIQVYLPDVILFYQQKVKVNPKTTKKSSVLKYLKKNTSAKPTDHDHDQDQLIDEKQVEGFFENVLINASTVASHDAFDLMEPTNSLKETSSVDFVKVSPYRPFGNYIFRTRGEDLDPSAPRQQLVVENPNAVLQLLFYFLQLPNEDQNLTQFAFDNLNENWSYEEELKNNELQLDQWNLESLNEHLLTSDGSTGDVVRTRNKALFELTPSAKWCLLAIEEGEKKKVENMEKLKKSMRKPKSNETDNTTKIIEDLFDKIPEYKNKCRNRNLDYYESFKYQNKHDDFEANVDRLEQAKFWDIVIEMVMRKDLPDEFEVWDEFVGLGTQFRRFYEPLDIANYYRHDKGDGYMDVRPKRYKFTQRWYQHANVMEFEPVSESNFVALVEELMKEVVSKKKKTLEEVKKELNEIENKVEMWKRDDKIINKHVFWGEFIMSELKEKLTYGHKLII